MLDICVPVQGPLKSPGFLRAALKAFLSCEWVVEECSALELLPPSGQSPYSSSSLFCLLTLLVLHAVHFSFWKTQKHCWPPRACPPFPVSYHLAAFTVLGAPGMHFYSLLLLFIISITYYYYWASYCLVLFTFMLSTWLACTVYLVQCRSPERFAEWLHS